VLLRKACGVLDAERAGDQDHDGKEHSGGGEQASRAIQGREPAAGDAGDDEEEGDHAEAVGGTKEAKETECRERAHRRSRQVGGVQDGWWLRRSGERESLCVARHGERHGLRHDEQHDERPPHLSGIELDRAPALGERARHLALELECVGEQRQPRGEEPGDQRGARGEEKGGADRPLALGIGREARVLGPRAACC
jgi:hypothetical protein